MDLGIDLGTTYSVLAVNGEVELVDDYPPGTYLEEADVTIIPSPDGDETFPSVATESPTAPERWLFGAEALEEAEDGAALVMFSKRKMGTDEEIPIGSRMVTAQDIAREFLCYLKQCAEEALGRTVQRAVVTHPAYFDRVAVEQTRQAAAEAGFDMAIFEQMLMEPVAAALTYTRADARDPLRILAYDLGGGTFDVTYLERRSGVIEMRAFDGDHLLGGYNFDRELAHWVRQRLADQGRQVSLNENDPEDRARLTRLLQLAEKIKLDLARAKTDTTKVEVRGRDVLVDTAGKTIQISDKITREQFISLIKPLLDRTVQCSLNALLKAEVEPDDVDEILLVGGSTHGPWISQHVAAAFPGIKPKQFRPDLCVAAGAAIHARLALPPLVAAGNYKLILDVPETTGLDTIHINGQVVTEENQPANKPLVAVLGRGTSVKVTRQPVNQEARFLFSDVVLKKDEANVFTLRIEDEASEALCEHPFEICYAPETTDAVTVTTVLPKPLFVETVNGFYPLAKEGETLPARCQAEFVTQFQRDELLLPLFQEFDQVGAIVIESTQPIPRASVVSLEVEVTENSEITGRAMITNQGKLFLEAGVRARFNAPEIPTVEHLHERFLQLKTSWLQTMLDPYLMEEFGAEGRELFAQVEKLFQQQPLERPEIHVLVRTLENIYDPPNDVMVPTRRELAHRLAGLRAVLRGKERDIEGELAGVETDEEAAGLRKRLEQCRAHHQALDVFKAEMPRVHQRRDRRKWSEMNDWASALYHEISDTPDISTESTTQIKQAAIHDIDLERHRLSEQVANLQVKNQLDRWKDDVARIEQGLQSAEQEVCAIDDDMPNDQAYAQVVQLFQGAIQRLRDEIAVIGTGV